MNSEDILLEADLDKVKTKTAKRLIAPLLYLLTSLNTDQIGQAESNHAKDRSATISRVKETLENFVSVGQEIIRNHPVDEGMEQLSDELEKIWIAGSDLLSVGADFAKDSRNVTLQSMTIDASRSTLNAMVKLLMVADMMDYNQKILKEIEVFKAEQLKFKLAVGKWDETENDLIALANRMYQIMANMTDFTRGEGPYQSTMDIIMASQELSHVGDRLNALARQVGSECVESNSKKDLFCYLERITLFCHQLNVTSKVKADVRILDDQVSRLESALCLIQNAKNLLNAVTVTVTAAEIASTKYRKPENDGPGLVQWKKVEPVSSSIRTPATNRRHSFLHK